MRRKNSASRKSFIRADRLNERKTERKRETKRARSAFRLREIFILRLFVKHLCKSTAQRERAYCKIQETFTYLHVFAFACGALLFYPCRQNHEYSQFARRLTRFGKRPNGFAFFGSRILNMIVRNSIAIQKK